MSNLSPSTKRTLKTLTLAEKVALIREVQKGAKKKSEIAADFGIRRNTLSTYLKNKDKIIQEYSSSQTNQSRKRCRDATNEELDGCVTKWFKQARDKKIPVSAQTITNGFGKAGFPVGKENVVIAEESLLEEPKLDEEYVRIDEEGANCGELADSEILEEVKAKMAPQLPDEEEEYQEPFPVVLTPSEALECLAKFRVFAESRLDANEEIFVALCKLNKFATKEKVAMRLCGDYKVTLNKNIEVDRYPLPRTEELLETIGEAQYFTKLDLSEAYQQVPLSKESQKLVVISTHLGLFKYTRLPYGVSTAPGSFRRIMATLLLGIPGLVVFLDDIYISAKDSKAHMYRLHQVLKRLEDADLRLKFKKCKFFQTQVEYIGYKINKQGIQPIREQLRSVLKAPPPKNITQLRSFLEGVNHYGRFIQNLAHKLRPLFDCLEKDKFYWSKNCSTAFENIKKELTSNKILVQFDPTKKIVLTTDASPYGISAILSHIDENNLDRPVCYASRTLTPAEKNYAHIEKEEVDIASIDWKVVQKETQNDGVLNKVIRSCLDGWPEKQSDGEFPTSYWTKKDALTVDNKCLFWGHRIVIPEKLRPLILRELHSSHFGGSRMKSLARSFVWWPNIDVDIEKLVKACDSCLQTRKIPPKIPLTPWQWPITPWHRLHADFLGPFLGKIILLMIDSHTKWPEAFIVPNMEENTTIEKI
ncbi:uncharacterized protein K02A2.6-like [Belonocnema kinseyi]|uniref:uncharacterized protein K02A2.6-like n=1 Tax=Belonocnema kinseyi TaxID=2817044 RepID=UPI00143DB5B4|nr:uncharacterized protein K02A2.6-like [Belonocnema kinseyi]